MMRLSLLLVLWSSSVRALQVTLPKRCTVSLRSSSVSAEAALPEEEKAATTVNERVKEWIKATPIAKEGWKEGIAKIYDVSKFVWIGASLDCVLKLSDPTGAGAFLVAAVVADRLAVASRQERLTQATYARLNVAFFLFGALQAAQRLGQPAALTAHAVTALACFVGALKGKSHLLDFKALLPRTRDGLCYTGLVTLPPIVAGIMIPSLRLSAIAYAAVGIVLQSAADRQRLNSTTFRRLNIALTFAFLTSAAGAYYQISHLGIHTMTLYAHVYTAVLASATPLYFGLRAIVQEDKL